MNGADIAGQKFYTLPCGKEAVWCSAMFKVTEVFSMNSTSSVEIAEDCKGFFVGNEF